MTQPSTGGDWSSVGLADTDNRFLERGGKIAALFRQARGTSTDISPHSPDGSVKYSPLAEDGKWRDDLFALKRVAGAWVLNTDPNEGWYLAGAFKEGDGPTVKSSFDDDDYMIEQSNMPYDSDRVKEDEPFTLTPVDTLRPVLRRIRNGLPLVAENGANLVELPGAPGAGFSKPVEYEPVEYQCLLVREFRRGGLPIRTVKGYSLVKNNNIGDAKMGKKDAEAAELTFKPLPDGIFMAVIDGVYKPIIKHEWIGGAGWTALGGATEEYLVTLGTQTSGTFTLTATENGVQRQTATNQYNATAANLKSALVALDDGHDAADWTVTGSAGGPYTVKPPKGVVVTGNGASLGTPGSFVIAPA